MSERKVTWLRRFRAPLILIVIAIAVSIVAARYERQRQSRIESFVRELCLDLAANRDVTEKLADSQPLIAHRLVAQIRTILKENPFAADAMTVTVVSGDPSTETGVSSAGTTSHTAIMTVGEIELLRIGVVDRGAELHPTIVGYSTTQ